QSFDGTTLWLNPLQSGQFRLAVNASDPQSGIASVDFPALFGTPANSDTVVPYQSSVYDFSSPSGQGSLAISATNGVTSPAAASDATSIQIDVDGSNPSSTTSFPLDNGSHDAADWAATCSPEGICGNANDAKSGLGSVEISLRDRTNGKWYGG